MKIKSLDNFTIKETLLNTELILGGRPETSGAGRFPSNDTCCDYTCYTADYEDSDGNMTWYDVKDCDAEVM